MSKIAFTIGPLDADQGAGLTVATAGWARALASLGGTQMTVFGRNPGKPVEKSLWEGVAVRMRGKPAGRLGELDLGLRSAIAAEHPAIIHSHGLWLAHQYSAWQAAKGAGIPRLVSPHGHLDAWALGRGRLKKAIAWRLYQRASLNAATCLHALHEGEVSAIRAVGLNNPVCVIPNGVGEAVASGGPAPWQSIFPPDAKILLFLGRITHQKGAVDLVRAWGRIARDPMILREKWKLALVGWPDPDVVGRVQTEIADNAMNDSVQIFDAQHGTAKANCFAGASAFILPSRSEGLPVAILEAWSYGLPVAMTAACNLPIGFAEGAAVEVGLEPVALAVGLKDFLSLPGAKLRALGSRGRQLTQTLFSWEYVAKQMMEVYSWCRKQSPAPATMRFP